MIIAVDWDGILNNLIEETINVYNIRNNKNISINDIKTYNFYECLPREDADGIVALFKEKKLWDSLKPLSEAQKGLKTLINLGHRVIIATATDAINFAWKMDWLKKYYPFFNQDNVIRIMDKSLLNCDVLIDDCLDNLTANLCERICLSYPWNQNQHIDYVYDIHRANSWTDIVNIVNKIERKNEKWQK